MGDVVGRLRVTECGRAGTTEAAEMALAHALLRRAGEGEVDEALRIRRPSRPTVVFGRRDTRLPDFAGAVRAAAVAGFDTAVRVAGGRVVAYTENALVVDVVKHEPGAVAGMDDRFTSFGDAMVEALRAIGVQSRLGAVQGEYCPGAHSVNARGAVKLVGTAQRILKDAWLFSSVVVVDDAARLQQVLTEVHRHLDLPFDPDSVGTVRDENPALTLDDVHRAFSEAFGVRAACTAPPDEAALALARDLEPGHRTHVARVR